MVCQFERHSILHESDRDEFDAGHHKCGKCEWRILPGSGDECLRGGDKFSSATDCWFRAAHRATADGSNGVHEHSCKLHRCCDWPPAIFLSVAKQHSTDLSAGECDGHKCDPDVVERHHCGSGIL